MMTALAFTDAKAAKIGFHCYSAPGTHVQAYEYGSSNCGSMKSSKTLAQIGQDGEKEVLCMYQAACEPVEGDEALREPPNRTMLEVQTRFQAGHLKSSILVCKGEGVLERGVLKNTKCPTPTQCQRDIFYNFSPVSFVPQGNPDPVLVPGAKSRAKKVN